MFFFIYFLNCPNWEIKDLHQSEYSSIRTTIILIGIKVKYSAVLNNHIYSTNFQLDMIIIKH